MSPHLRAVVIHGHFYQPPRDDPWLDRVLTEPSAAPFHDWNARIEHECYGPLVANHALSSISFDFGSTLFEWLERNAPGTYAGVLEADRASAVRLDGGSDQRIACEPAPGSEVSADRRFVTGKRQQVA